MQLSTQLRKNLKALLYGSLFGSTLAMSSLSGAGVDVTSLGVTPSQGTDSTAAVQQVLNEGPSTLFFPEGNYEIGSIEIPGDKVLIFDPKAVITPLPEKIGDRTLFTVTGDNVRIDGLRYDFGWNGAGREETPVWRLIYADGVSHLTVSNADVKNSDERGMVPLEDRRRRGRFLNFDGTDPAKNYSHPGYFNTQVLLYVDSCKNVVLENSIGSRLHAMLEANYSENVISRGNHMTSGNYLARSARGGESFRHHDNWSRDVKYQVVWSGGSPDPSRKQYLPRGSSTVVHRDVKFGDPGFNPHTSGAFDVFIQNNYAEYGNTLAWGNKGRQVVIDGNIARFIADYAYGTEGGETIIFSNNVSINSTAGGIASMYWGEKLLITGNLIITRHEPWDPEFSWWDQPSKYLGQFVRLHHGPYNKEDMYGAGSVQISGNLFVNELSQRTTEVSVQAGRDVLISGNKFINGGVNKFGEGRVTVMDNEFVSRLEYDPLFINIRPQNVDAAIIKGNIFRKEPAVAQTTPDQQAAELHKVPYFLFTGDDQVGMENEEAPVPGDMPAISIAAPNKKFFALVQDNFIYGWKEAIKGNARKDASFIVLNNTTDGTIEVNEARDAALRKVEGNISLPSGLMP